MNIAYGFKAISKLNLLSFSLLPAVSPMLKAKLPEANQPATSIYGYHHYRDGMINVSLNLYRRLNEIVNITQTNRISLNVENLPTKGDTRVVMTTIGLPKGINSYGNGAVIVPAAYNTLYVKNNILRKERTAVNNLLSSQDYSTGCTSLQAMWK